jgi:hypothetical protein
MIESEPARPSDPWDAARWEIEARRYRMLYGRHLPDLKAELAKQVGVEVAAAWGTPDLSANPARKACSGRSTLYDAAWEIQHDDPAAAIAVFDALEAASALPLLQRLQRDTIGIREMLLDVRSNGPGIVVLRPVVPHRVIAVPDPRDPSTAIEIREARLRELGNGPGWVWDIYRLNAGMRVVLPSGPVILDANDQPVTDGFVGLPFVWYHAAFTGLLFDPYEEQELYWGSLTVGVLWTMFTHIVRDCSWPQRWSINVGWGPEQQADDIEVSRRHIIADAATVLEGVAGEGRPAQIGQWMAGGDPVVVAQAIERYERRISSELDLDSADANRASGDITSGYALAVSTAAKETAQRRYAPTFRRSDEHLCRRVAEELNKSGSKLPVTGYHVRYWFEVETDRLAAIENLSIKTPSTATLETPPLDRRFKAPTLRISNG